MKGIPESRIQRAQRTKRKKRNVLVQVSTNLSVNDKIEPGTSNEASWFEGRIIKVGPHGTILLLEREKVLVMILR